MTMVLELHQWEPILMAMVTILPLLSFRIITVGGLDSLLEVFFPTCGIEVTGRIVGEILMAEDMVVVMVVVTVVVMVAVLLLEVLVVAVLGQNLAMPLHKLGNCIAE